MKKAANKKTAYLAIVVAMTIIFVTVIIVTFGVKNLINESSLVVSASTDASVRAAEQRLREAQENVKQLQAARQAAERERNNLASLRNNLAAELAVLDAEMAVIVANIAELELEIEIKIMDIEQAELDLAEAIWIKDKQYADMKRRVQFAYERQEFLLIEAFLSASNLSELLNMADYFEQLERYDQRKLDEFHETERMVENKKNILKDEKETLDGYLAAVIVEQGRVTDLISKTQRHIVLTRAQIEEAEKDLQAKEREQKLREEEAKQAERDLAEQLRLRELARQRVWRDLSELHFDEGDRYLLANLIFCEAGGEPYEGKVAVGAVVINRMRSAVFPTTMVGVIYQRRQFSPVGNGRLALALQNDRATASCYRAADEAMAGASPVGNALFFRTPIPGLDGQFIGGHVFY